MIKQESKSSKDWSCGLIEISVMVLLAGALVLAGPTVAFADQLPQGLEQMILDHLSSAEEQSGILLDIAENAIKDNIPEHILATVIKRSFEAGLTGQDIGEMLQILIEASKENLPVEPLADKILEGLSKKIDAYGIIKALENVSKRMSAEMADTGLGIAADNAADAADDASDAADDAGDAADDAGDAADGRW